jgi:hypothetical protein
MASLREDVHEPIGQSAAGLILWTGNGWERFPWLKELPAADSPKSGETLDEGQGMGAAKGGQMSHKDELTWKSTTATEHCRRDPVR